MCITNPSKISDFRENLLHMLLFWTLILFDSYAYSYKNRGCRMCNSPFFAFYGLLFAHDQADSAINTGIIALRQCAQQQSAAERVPGLGVFQSGNLTGPGRGVPQFG